MSPLRAGDTQRTGEDFFENSKLGLVLKSMNQYMMDLTKYPYELNSRPHAVQSQEMDG